MSNSPQMDAGNADGLFSMPASERRHGHPMSGTPIATLDLDHSTLVLLSDDTDGFGFYVASEHTAVTWDDAGERCVIATPDGDDEITADELDDLRRGVAREFRRKGEDAGAVRCARRGLWAECLHGNAPPPCAAQPAITPNPATPAEETHMLRITSETLTDSFAQLTGAHDYLTGLGVRVVGAHVTLTGPEMSVPVEPDHEAVLARIDADWRIVAKDDNRAVLVADLNGVRVLTGVTPDMLRRLPEVGLVVRFGAVGVAA